MADTPSMLSSIGAAMSGLASATNRFDRASAKIAQPDPTADPVADRVDQLTAAHDFAANLATVRTADDMVGTLINTIA
jgi:hypothetical protein